jgi:hypothetical protein
MIITNLKRNKHLRRAEWIFIEFYVAEGAISISINTGLL